MKVSSHTSVSAFPLIAASPSSPPTHRLYFFQAPNMHAAFAIAAISFVPAGPIAPTTVSSSVLLASLHTAPTHLQQAFADPNFGTLRSGMSSTASHGMTGAPHEILRKRARQA